MMLKQESGSALMTAMFAVLALSLVLSAAAIVPYYNARFYVRAIDDLQAYYYARSGINLARGFVVHKMGEDPAYLDDPLWIHSGIEALDGLDSFTATRTEPEGWPIAVRIHKLSEEKVSVEAEGVYGDATRSIVLVLNRAVSGEGAIPGNVDIAPLSERGEEDEAYYHSGKAAIEWTNPDGSMIQGSDGVISAEEKSILFRTDANQILQASADDFAPAWFQAPEMHFESPLQITGQGEVHLYSRLVVFHHDVRLVGQNSSLCLAPYQGEEYGYVYFVEEVTLRGNNYQGLYEFGAELSCAPFGDQLTRVNLSDGWEGTYY